LCKIPHRVSITYLPQFVKIGAEQIDYSSDKTGLNHTFSR